MIAQWTFYGWKNFFEAREGKRYMYDAQENKRSK